ncbi:MAG: NfeD family protein [Bacilli bacterium]
MFYIWLAVVILLAIVEIISINLTTIWFVISGVLALFLSFIVDNFLIQFAVFVIIGIVLLITTKPYLERILKSRNIKTNLDRVEGMTGVVTEEITKKSFGEVKVDGKLWTAYADKKIKVNAMVKILKIDGVKLKVEEVGE